MFPHFLSAILLFWSVLSHPDIVKGLLDPKLKSNDLRSFYLEVPSSNIFLTASSDAGIQAPYSGYFTTTNTSLVGMQFDVYNGTDLRIFLIVDNDYKIPNNCSNGRTGISITEYDSGCYKFIGVNTNDPNPQCHLDVHDNICAAGNVNVGGNLTVDGFIIGNLNGTTCWTCSTGSTCLGSEQQYFVPNSYIGDPLGPSVDIVLVTPNGGALARSTTNIAFGDLESCLGLLAVDLQGIRENFTTGATGDYSGSLSGANNTAAGDFTTTIGGSFNFNNATFSSSISGFQNFVEGGIYIVIGTGTGHAVTGQFGYGSGFFAGSNNLIDTSTSTSPVVSNVIIAGDGNDIITFNTDDDPYYGSYNTIPNGIAIFINNSAFSNADGGFNIMDQDFVANIAGSYGVTMTMSQAAMIIGSVDINMLTSEMAVVSASDQVTMGQSLNAQILATVFSTVSAVIFSTMQSSSNCIMTGTQFEEPSLMASSIIASDTCTMTSTILQEYGLIAASQGSNMLDCAQSTLISCSNCVLNVSGNSLAAGTQNSIQGVNNNFLFGVGLISQAFNNYTYVSFGQWNEPSGPAPGDMVPILGQRVLTVGVGTSDVDRKNGFSVDVLGNVYALGSFYVNGADFAEFFDYQKEERVEIGTPVNINRDGTFRITQEGELPQGVVSDTAGYCGNYYLEKDGQISQHKIGLLGQMKVKIGAPLHPNWMVMDHKLGATPGTVWVFVK